MGIGLMRYSLYWLNLLNLLKKYATREIIAYLVCGVLTTLVGLVAFWLCDRAAFPVALSNTVSTAAAVVFAYFANKIFVFGSKSWAPALLAKEILSFAGSRLATFVMETLLLMLLVDALGLPGFWCKVFTSVLVVVGNYVLSKWVVFVEK